MVATAAAQDSTVPVQIVNAEIDNTDIYPNGKNVLDLERDEEFTLKFEMISSADVDDVEVRAFISGYEYSDISDISARAGPFDFSKDVTYVKKLTLRLPNDLPVDDYKLRVIVADRFGNERLYRYDLSINSERHDVRVDDVVLSPGSTVEAGQALLATVRLENFGQKDQDDVKVTVSIPQLGVSGSAYIEEVEADETEQTEEMFLRLPKCAEAGQYELHVKAEYNNGRDMSEKTMTVNVLENEACEVAAPVVVIENNSTMTEAQPSSPSKVRAALEIVLLVLLALLVIVGLVIGFSRMRAEE
jgi:uncharacterized membrane protein